jgi:hypothetical protein
LGPDFSLINLLLEDAPLVSIFIPSCLFFCFLGYIDFFSTRESGEVKIQCQNFNNDNLSGQDLLRGGVLTENKPGRKKRLPGERRID